MNSEQPTAGVTYPIVLGSSFFDGSQNGTDFSTLRLDFIPASCDRTSPGNLHIDPENKAASLFLPSTNNSNTIHDTVEFQGKFESSKDDLDCIAIFNSETQAFTLELLSGGQATLRHMPGSKRDKDNVDNNKKKQGDAGARKGNASASVPPPLPATTAAATAAAPPNRRKPAAPAAAVPTGSKDTGDIEDEFFHGALD